MKKITEPVVVEVLYGIQYKCANCEGGCSDKTCEFESTYRNYEDATLLLAEELNEIYGDSVKVKFIKVDISGLDEYPTVREALSAGYKYPITLINGVPRFEGGIMIYEIKKIIAEMYQRDGSCDI